MTNCFLSLSCGKAGGHEPPLFPLPCHILAFLSSGSYEPPLFPLQCHHIWLFRAKLLFKMVYLESLKCDFQKFKFLKGKKWWLMAACFPPLSLVFLRFINIQRILKFWGLHKNKVKYNSKFSAIKACFYHTTQNVDSDRCIRNPKISKNFIDWWDCCYFNFMWLFSLHR